jgi:hypothetical protein
MATAPMLMSAVVTAFNRSAMNLPLRKASYALACAMSVTVIGMMTGLPNAVLVQMMA